MKRIIFVLPLFLVAAACAEIPVENKFVDQTRSKKAQQASGLVQSDKSGQMESHKDSLPKTPKTQKQPVASIQGKLSQPVKFKIGQTVAFNTDDKLTLTFNRVVQDNRWCGNRMPYPNEKAVVELSSTLVHPQGPKSPTVFKIDEFAEYTIMAFNQKAGAAPHEYRIKLDSLEPITCSQSGGPPTIETFKDLYEATVTVIRSVR